MADITGFPPTTVHRKLRKAHEKGFVPSPHPKTDDDDELRSVPEQVEQQELNLPYKDD